MDKVSIHPRIPIVRGMGRGPIVSPLAVTIPPTNISSGTAYDLTGLLPFEGTENLSGISSPYEVWFKYTFQSNDFAISFWAWNSDSSDYQPWYFFYLSPDLTTSLRDATWAPFQFFLEESVGVPKVGTVYIKIKNLYEPDPPDSVPMYVRVERIPNTSVPAGGVLINDDTLDQPTVIYSPTGQVLQMRSLPKAGESAVALTNGITLWEHSDDLTKYFLYDSNLELIATPAPWTRGGLQKPLSSNRRGTFYVGNDTGALCKITTISETGVLGPTIWTVSGLYNFYHICPNWAETVIYIRGNHNPYNVSLDGGICKFHPGTGVLDAPFLINPVGYQPVGVFGYEFLVFPDESLVVPYRTPSVSFVRHWSSTGTIIRDYPYGTNDVNRITHGKDNTTFWIWSFPADENLNEFTEYRLSDGVQLNQFTSPVVNHGDQSYQPESLGDSLFGSAESCPFLVYPTVIPIYGGSEPEPEPTELSGIYFINTHKTTGQHDSYYDDIEKKIPNPTVKTTLLGE